MNKFQPHDTTLQKTGLDNFGKKGIAREYLRVLIYFIVLFASSGKIGWINMWIYIGISIASFAFYHVLMIRINPQLLNERGRFIREDTKAFDKAFYAMMIPLIFGLLIVSGLDGGRYGWSEIPFIFTLVAIAIYILATAFSLWAIAVNTHFEATVRIQKDRDHKVCTTGPYRYVRHPGYVGIVVTSLSAPLILDSWWGLIPGTAIVLAVIFRTALEDRTLQNELDGYKEYSLQTRYRLIPLVW